MPLSGTLALLRDGRVTVPTLEARQVSSDHQRKQIPSGAPIRTGNVEKQRARWLSRVNPMAGSWSLAAYPRSYRPVTPSGKLPAISPHPFGRSTRRIRRLGDFARRMIKRQGESYRAELHAVSDDYQRVKANAPSRAGDGPCPADASLLSRAQATSHVRAFLGKVDCYPTYWPEPRVAVSFGCCSSGLWPSAL